MIKKILLILITLFLPPVGVFIVAGCGADLLINIALTLLGFLPGHVHAFWLEHVYFRRRDEIRAGTYDGRLQSGIYSQKVQRGGMSEVPVQGAGVPPAVV
ncbi:hypothetical protein E8E13_001021 [Curvularia kusanoi]|uniref:Plasma membrane proteolipid 3 n=1 Tax=Curvularia kusanoi TaxID=90978 RepID=A0A9P4WC88_CURKU|nr:hypothetical protein E8E13_001021 [Curvularia kusanoi]